MSLTLSVLYYALGQFVPDTYSPPLSLLSLQCGIGHFISRDSFGKPNCVTCPQGRFGVADGAVGLKGCKQCPRGKYQPNRGQGFCFSDHNSMCPAGTYNALARSDGPGRVVWQPLSSASDGLPACAACPPGQVQGKAFDAKRRATYQVCRMCRPGRHQPLGAQTGTCVPCSAGRYQPIRGQKHCVACSPGQFIDRKGSAHCSFCAAGTAVARPASTVCTLCPPGKHMERTGAQQCLRCWRNYVQPRSGQTSCDHCEPGRYTNINATTCLAVIVATHAPSPAPSPRPTQPGILVTTPAASATTTTMPRPRPARTALRPRNATSRTVNETARNGAHRNLTTVAPVGVGQPLVWMWSVIGVILLLWSGSMLAWAMCEQTLSRQQLHSRARETCASHDDIDETTRIVQDILSGGSGSVEMSGQVPQYTGISATSESQNQPPMYHEEVTHGAQLAL